MAEDYKLINQKIEPVSAVALLVGTALDMSIFVVPTQTAAEAGPSIVVAALISVVPMAFGVLLLLQLGGAIPVAGGVYVYGSRLVGPLWGMVSVFVPFSPYGRTCCSRLSASPSTSRCSSTPRASR
ncbi:MAG: amino acid permease [Halobacteriales archaeon]